MRSECCLLALSLVACSTRTHNLASSMSDDAGSPRDAARDAVGETRIVLCGDAPCVCANGLDDDGDGLVDGFDPECTSAADQYEDSFASGVHGEDQTQRCQDCFFDDNSGAGDDGCARARSCALDGTPSGGSGMCRQCSVEVMCTDSCLPLVPNGCDCFGCCGVWRDGAQKFVLLASSCSLLALDDGDSCAACVPATDCQNPCGRCELCPGRSPSDLPADCSAPSGPGYACDEGRLCRASSDCAPDEYCQQGCCLALGI